MEKVNIDNIDVILSSPDTLETNWQGQDDIIRQIVASWITVDEKDIALTPRIVGKPGTGKTSVAYHVGKNIMKQDVYIFQCSMDTRPEDLIITPVISDENKISYHGSSIVSAMIKGGVAILDEANRMSEKSWASLAPLLDDRRYVKSIVSGVKVKAHKDFRLIATMNDDASTFDLPEYIHSRLQPTVEVSFPTAKEEYDIIKINVPFADEDLLKITVGFLQRSHSYDGAFSIRDGVNIARYAMKLRHENYIPTIEDAFIFSLKAVLGKEGLALISTINKNTEQTKTQSDFDIDNFEDNYDEYDDDDDILL